MLNIHLQVDCEFANREKLFRKLASLDLFYLSVCLPALFTKLPPTFVFQQVFANIGTKMRFKIAFQIREGSRVKNQERWLPNPAK